MKLTHLFKAFSCDQCERSFGMEKDLIKHKRTHLDKPKENFDCEECHLTFKNKYRKKIHVLEIHEKKFDYPCSECDRKFCLKSQLNHHFGSAHKGRNRIRIWISASTFKPKYRFDHCSAFTCSVRPKPLFWFRSDTDTETQIGRYHNRYWNHILKEKSSYQ